MPAFTILSGPSLKRYASARFVALSRPSRPASMSNVTFWLSARPVRPARSTAEMWTKTSLLPPSGAIKPKPFVELNHFTVPLAISVVSCLNLLSAEVRQPGAVGLDRRLTAIKGRKQRVEKDNVSGVAYDMLPGIWQGVLPAPGREQNPLNRPFCTKARRGFVGFVPRDSGVFAPRIVFRACANDTIAVSAANFMDNNECSAVTVWLSQSRTSTAANSCRSAGVGQTHFGFISVRPMVFRNTTV